MRAIGLIAINVRDVEKKKEMSLSIEHYTPILYFIG